MITHSMLQLAAAFSILSIFVRAQGEEYARKREISPARRAALFSSLAAAAVCGIALLAAYGFREHWYSPLIVVLVSSIVGNIVYTPARGTAAVPVFSSIGFAAWPVCIAWGALVLNLI